MSEWNVVVSVYDRGYKHARQILEEFGPVSRTDFYNVLTVQVADVPGMLEKLKERLVTDEKARISLARIVPVSAGFTFQSPEEFEAKAKETVLPWVPELAGKGVHVRMHRRGFKGRLSSQDEERFLDGFLLDKLEQAGTPGRITFEDPDAIVVIETISQRAGLALFTREDLRNYPSLKAD
jgi:tRNA(Ser,Leu) C12 N-acetylase TAN1